MGRASDQRIQLCIGHAGAGFNQVLPDAAVRRSLRPVLPGCPYTESMRLPHAILCGATTALTLLAAQPPMTRLTIEVTDLKGDPVEQASVTVRFVEGRSVKSFGKEIVTRYHLKTDSQGIARIPPIPQGKILVQVIAKRFQTFGEVFEVYEPERTIQVQLKPPQPQYSVHSVH